MVSPRATRRTPSVSRIMRRYASRGPKSSTASSRLASWIVVVAFALSDIGFSIEVGHAGLWISSQRCRPGRREPEKRDRGGEEERIDDIEDATKPRYRARRVLLLAL